MWITLNFLFWFFLLIVALMGLNQKYTKKLVKGLILSRIFYILLIISQVMLTFFYVKSRPVVMSLSDIFCLLSAAVIEIGFRKKEQGRAKDPKILIFIILIIYMIFETWAILPTTVY